MSHAYLTWVIYMWHAEYIFDMSNAYAQDCHMNRSYMHASCHIKYKNITWRLGRTCHIWIMYEDVTSHHIWRCHVIPQMNTSCHITYEYVKFHMNGSRHILTHVNMSCHIWPCHVCLPVSVCVCLSVCHTHSHRLRQIPTLPNENAHDCHMSGTCHLLTWHVIHILLMSHMHGSCESIFVCLCVTRTHTSRLWQLPPLLDENAKNCYGSVSPSVTEQVLHIFVYIYTDIYIYIDVTYICIYVQIYMYIDVCLYIYCVCVCIQIYIYIYVCIYRFMNIVCVRVCIQIYVYIYIDIRVYTLDYIMCVCVCACVYSHVYTWYTHALDHICADMHVYIHVCLNKYICTCFHVYIHIYIRTYVFMNMYICMYTYSYIYVYTYIYICTYISINFCAYI